MEFADVILLNKTDLVSPRAAGTVEATLRRLNPTAQLIRTDHGNVTLDRVLETGLYNPELAAQVPGWDEELAGGHTPETEEYGIRSVTYRASRPFHPARLEAALGQFAGLLRSKGFCWIASRPEFAAIWSQAGPQPRHRTGSTVGVGGGGARAGDRVHRSETGPGGASRILDPALLTDDELREGPRAWTRYEDPLPAWDQSHLH